jgi:hypothetical protein
METKTRRPLYGGERGIRNRSQDGINLLRLFAKSDFKHDFGEDVSTRDKFVNEDLQRFLEICQKYGLSKVAALRKGFDNVLGQNPYKLLKDTIPAQIYPVPGDENDYKNEEFVLESIGINYSKAIKDPIKAYKRGKTDEQYLNAPCVLPPLTIIAGNGVTRTYTVSSVPLKVGGETANIATMFNRVTNGNNEFALIVDAAGGLSLTSIQNAGLGPYEPEKQYKFYIIENIENDSDSATKVKHLDKSTRKGPDGKPTTNVEVLFLKDGMEPVIYQPFSSDVVAKQLIESQTENLFGNAQLVLSRSGDETEADFIYPDGEQYKIENVSQNANVKNASLNMVASTLANRGREAFLFAYLKRVGDWCQALSLLDTSRPYTVLNLSKDKVGDAVTLKKLQEKGTAVALVTLDRILLAYALLLGVDVFFTTGSDVSSLLYFKNNEVELTPKAVQDKIVDLEGEVQALQPEIIPVDPSKEIGAVLGTVKANLYDIQLLRSFFSNISMMRFDFDILQKSIIERYTGYDRNQADPKNISYLTDLVVSMKKYKLDKEHNARALASIQAKVYPDLVFEKETFAAMGRSSRNVIARLREIISKKLYTDAVQVKSMIDSGKLTGFTVAELIPMAPPAQPPALQEAYPAFSVVYSAVAPMKGGGKEDFYNILHDLTQFQVKPVDYDEYERLITRPEEELRALEDSEFPAAIAYSYYRDDKGFPYTVFDEVLITKEDIPTYARLVRISGDPEAASVGELPDICYRFLLLYSDILRGRYERLKDSEDNYVNDDPTQPIVFGQTSVESDVKFSEHKRIHYDAMKLQEIVSNLQTTPIPQLFMYAWNSYNETELLDNDTINAMVMGRGGVRLNDYTKTCELITTIRINLLQFKGVQKIQPYLCQVKSAKLMSEKAVKAGPKTAAISLRRKRQTMGGKTRRSAA